MKITECIDLLKNSQLICITGKMASGKNYVCSIFEKKGWFSVDADILVHQAIDQSTQLILNSFNEIAQSQNINLLDDEGKINRRELGKILFSSPELLEKQEKIVYPVITKMVQKIISEHSKVILNATVLYKTPDLLKMCEAIVFVQSNTIKRLIRARHRDSLPYKQIFKRFKTQKNLLKEYKKFEIPIFIVNN